MIIGISLLICCGTGDNNPPDIPITPLGPSESTIRTSDTFKSLSYDTDRDSVAIKFDWGDGSSFLSRFVRSGDTIKADHPYSAEGIYYIKARAFDRKGGFSDWSGVKTIRITK